MISVATDLIVPRFIDPRIEHQLSVNLSIVHQTIGTSLDISRTKAKENGELKRTSFKDLFVCILPYTAKNQIK